MSVDDGSGNRFGPPAPFPFGGGDGGMGGGGGMGGDGGGMFRSPMGGGFGSSHHSHHNPPRAFVPSPSSSPAYSASLHQQQNQGIHLPDLMIFIRGWHQGKVVRSPEGKRITIPWFCIEVVHLDTGTVVLCEDCPPDAGRASQDVENEIAKLIEQRIEGRARGMGDGGMHRFEVRCHFRSEDGSITHWEPYTVPVTLPPQTPQWGQPHYGGSSGGGSNFSSGFGGGGFGGGGFGGGGGGMFGGSNAFGGPQSQAVAFARLNIDSAQRSDNVLMGAIEMYKDHARRLEASNNYYVSQDMSRMQLMQQLNDQSRRNRLDEQMAEIKMAALQTAMEKFFAAVPLGLVVANRWIQQKKEERDGTGTPREKKAVETLRKIMLQLEKSPMGSDPQMIRGLLQSAGIEQETLDDTFALFQEFAFDRMMEGAEKSTKQSILGMGDDGDASGGIQKLLRAAGVTKPGDASAQQPGAGEKKEVA